VGSTKNFPKFVFQTTKEKCALLSRPIPTREALLYSTFGSDVKDFFLKSLKIVFYNIMFLLKQLLKKSNFRESAARQLSPNGRPAESSGLFMDFFLSISSQIAYK
jgi:hypothetical protein